MLPSPELAVSLMLWVAAHVGMPPFEVPEIVESPPTKMISLNGGRPACGLYVWKDSTIHLPFSWNPDSIVHRACLVHELEHHTHWVSGELSRGVWFKPNSCLRARLEKSGFETQFAYLREHGISDPLKASKLDPKVYTMLTTCEPPQ